MKYILLLSLHPWSNVINLFKKYRKWSSNASDSVIGDKKELEKQVNVTGFFFNFKKKSDFLTLNVVELAISNSTKHF